MGIRSTTRNPFIVKVDELLDDVREDRVAEFQNDRNYRDPFGFDTNVEGFWRGKAIACPDLREIEII